VATAGRQLSAYLPRLVREWIVAAPEMTTRVEEGTLVLVDISGFTRLSERLARLGRAGAEELSEAISACFTRLLAVAYGEGGMLVKFGGDALLLLFVGDDHQVRGCRAVAGMRRTLRHIGRISTPVGGVVLRMSAGVHSGDIHSFLVGASHRELLVAGPAASTTVRMQAAAAAGEVLLSPATAARLPASALGAATAGGVLLRHEPAGLPPVPAQPDAATADDVLAPFVPAAIRAHLTAAHIEPEHRHATVAFLRFGGFDELLRQVGAAEAADRLHALVAAVQRAVDHHGVSFLGSDVDQDGGKLVLAAGAPTTRGDDDERMLLALDEIVRARIAHPLSGCAMTLRVGVHRGPVFAGDVGPAYRRTYTVMGDAVNVAARLMAHARDGEVLVSPHVAGGGRTRFATTPVTPFAAKGKRRPIEAVRLDGILGSAGPAADALPLVGRDAELTALTDALTAARAGRGGVVRVVGEAGLGKSRLLAALTRAARPPAPIPAGPHPAGADAAAGTTVLALACHPYDATTPYAAFRTPLRGLLGIRPDVDRWAAGQQLEAAVAHLAPGVRPWLPLLAAVLDASVPATPEVDALDPSFRAARLGSAVLDLLDAVIPGPAMVAVEDADWLDDASADLLDRLAAATAERPWLVCTTARGEDTAGAADGRAVTLRLGPLATTDAVALAQAAVGAAPLPGQDVAALVERAGGNPFFLVELVAAARDASRDLPDCVEGVVLARIDGLPPVLRTVLRHLAVLGHTFPTALADAVLPAGERSRLPELTDFLRLDGDRIAFRHALLRDVAYGSVPFRTRRAMHAAAGDVLAALGDVEQRADLLSFHYVHAERYGEAWTHARHAADAASQVHAHAAAAALYARALACVRHLPDLADDQVAAVWEALGDAHDACGRYEQAAAAYRACRRRLVDDPVGDARVMLKIARQQGWLRRYSQSLRWITRGLRTLEADTTSEADCQRAQLTAWYGHFLQEQGRSAEAIAWCRRAVSTARGCGELEALAHAHRMLDWAFVSLGQLDQAVHSAEALALYERLGDLTGQAHTLHNLASITYLRGEWDEALRLNRRARALYARTGNEVSGAFSDYNVAEILFDQGLAEEAGDLMADVRRVALAAGRRSLAALADRHLGRIAADAGRRADALRHLDAALTAFHDLGARAEVIETEVRLAEAHLLAGDADVALALADRAAEGARALGGVSMSAPALLRIRGAALLRLGDLPAARDALEAALATARAREATFDEALCLRAMADLIQDGGAAALPDRSLEQLHADSAALLWGLGVRRAPQQAAGRPALGVA
jgi:class 3 adenylate cyclase/tetratricopeptide (TPR) repeat protein